MRLLLFLFSLFSAVVVLYWEMSVCKVMIFKERAIDSEEER